MEGAPGDRSQGTRRGLSVEPSLLLLAYSFAVYEAPFNDLLLIRVCQQTPRIPREWCDDLREHPAAEEVVHPMAANLLMISTLLETVFPAVWSCLAGAWSDRAGSRKPLVITPLAGYVLKFSLLAVTMGSPWLPVECFLLASLPVAMSGGWTTYFGAVTSVVGDETSAGANRTFRLGLLQVVFILGLLPGGLTSSATLRALGHTGVFLLAGLFCFFALLISLYTVSETYTAGNGEGGDQGGCLAKDVVQTVIKNRANGQRTSLVLSVLSLASSIVAYNGESNLYYMYGRKEFRWTIMDFTLYKSVLYALQMVGTFFAVSFLSRKMSVADAPLAILGYLGACFGSVARAFATSTWMMYLGSVISLFHGAASPMMRSIISKSVSQNELGKVFTLTTSIEALVPLAAQPLYTYLFSSTISSFPGAFFVFSALMFFIDLIFSCVIHGTQIWYSRPEMEPLLRREDAASNSSD